MVIPMMCLTMLLTAPVTADSQPPTTRPAPLAGSAELQAEWDRYFPADEQQALAAIVDGDRTNIEHRAFFVLWDAAGKLTDAQLRAAPEVTDIEDLVANPQKYRGRLVSIYVAVRNVLRPEERIHRATGKPVMIHAADCARKVYTLRAWTREAGGRTGRNEGLLIRGFFYKTFRYTPHGARNRGETAIGLGLVSRRLKKATAAGGWEISEAVKYVLAALFVVVLAVAVVAFLFSRRPMKRPDRTE